MASRNGQELNGFWNGRVRKDPQFLIGARRTEYFKRRRL